MQTWHSYHFYPLETPDVFLARAIRPFLEQFIWSRKGARAFFIRYADEKGPHIRLRLRAEADWLEETLHPALQGWFAERGAWEEKNYEPETGRFGGPNLIGWAEEHFHISTRVTLNLLNREFTYGDAMFEALHMKTVVFFAAGLSRAEAAAYSERLSRQWCKLFFQPEDGKALEAADEEAVFSNFEQALEAQKEGLQQHFNTFWETLETDKLDPKQADMLRWLRGNQLILKAFDQSLEKVLPSLLHLNNNRLGIGNQDEVYLCHILAKVL